MHLTKIPKNKPRYERSERLAYSFILNEKISKLPVNLFAIADKNQWLVIKAGDYAKSRGVSLEYVLQHTLKSKDGVVIYYADADVFLIVYNEQIESSGRIRWTLAHEIGHIVLGHLTDFSQSQLQRGLSDAEYNTLEKEADCFASYLLSPLVVLRSMKVRSILQIEQRCGLSNEAARNRFKFYKTWCQSGRLTPIDHRIYLQFYDYIYQKSCPICGNHFTSRNAKYCPICSGSLLYWGDGKMVYNDGYELDSNGRALKCPKCQNEQMESNGSYCRICGTYIINRCTVVNECDRYGNLITEECGVIASSNARYCEVCGHTTSFYEQGLLLPWEDAQIQLQNKYTNESEAAASIEQFENFDWDNVITTLKSRGKVLLYANLIATKAILSKDGMLHIYINNSSYTFGSSVVSRKENRDTLISLIEDMYDVKILGVITHPSEDRKAMDLKKIEDLSASIGVPISVE